MRDGGSFPTHQSSTNGSARWRGCHEDKGNRESAQIQPRICANPGRRGQGMLFRSYVGDEIFANDDEEPFVVCRQGEPAEVRGREVRNIGAGRDGRCSGRSCNRTSKITNGKSPRPSCLLPNRKSKIQNPYILVPIRLPLSYRRMPRRNRATARNGAPTASAPRPNRVRGSGLNTCCACTVPT